MVLLIAGCTALFAAWVPAYTARRPLSLPLLLVVLGVVLFLVPLGLPRFVVSDHLLLIERVTEVGVLVSLMGAGLKIDRIVSWRTWSSTWRLLAIGMPLSILASAFLGWWGLGLGAAGALLLGSVLAPTDPVLAADVQVGEPEVGDRADLESEDEVRFTLTSEAGLNDALAFPFVYGAIRLVDHGPSAEQLLSWIAVDVVYRLGVGLLVGLAVGWLIGRISFSAPGPLQSLAESPQGFVAIAVMLMAYGGTQMLGGYGFLAVFVSAVALRSAERRHEFHTHLHEFVEQSENLLMVGLLVLLGGALMGGALAGLTWQAALVAAAIVLLVRPLCSFIALIGQPMLGADRAAIAVFGIKGIGSLYYLAFAAETHEFAQVPLLWATTVFAILVSVVFHGVTATPAMAVADRSRAAWSRARGRRHDRRAAPV